jgi:hypothetical protein
MLESLLFSNSTTNSQPSALAESVIKGIRSTIQRAAVRVASVDTQTFSLPTTTETPSSDQAVPMALPTASACSEETKTVQDSNKSSTLTAQKVTHLDGKQGVQHAGHEKLSPVGRSSPSGERVEEGEKTVCGKFD